MLVKPVDLHQPKPRSMNMAKRSDLLSGNDCLVYSLSAGFIPLLPHVGWIRNHRIKLHAQHQRLLNQRQYILRGCLGVEVASLQ